MVILGVAICLLSALGSNVGSCKMLQTSVTPSIFGGGAMSKVYSYAKYFLDYEYATCFIFGGIFYFLTAPRKMVLGTSVRALSDKGIPSN